mmetsp:Transcript_41006/g.60202  ORF Transcript_41006/g.60202 Transcript_41006/m.60202 type:complete len:235 (-) Transcript_41006:336-1040(-)|eukprot:CAMPEP_0195518218 /NCGR_PEP_ID=MMETSP0794_2-20130614/12590_1 /TAXON_ID=515487 /ORGANISM="Stephanopyxis turris, Strain CCMP 815" /LENGTH=234 /DNA_ID=CAMNT_0040647149 /DNA_START=117 /DNA_END=821 /DNA_ORIENTATION=+
MSLSSDPAAPLLPRVDAILVLDGDGNRLAGKYYGDFLSTKPLSNGDSLSSSTEELRLAFERQLHGKIQGISAKADAAEVVTVAGKTAVFCGGIAGNQQNTGGAGGDVRVVFVGPLGESELVLAHFAEGMFDALSNLMGGQTDRAMVLDNLELVLLLIDELCDGGLVLETDGGKLYSSVLLRDDDGMGTEQGGGQPGAGPGAGMTPIGTGEMTIGQALRQAREQLITNLAQRDGM